MTTSQELGGKLEAINAQLTKASGEITTQVDALKAQLEAANTLTPEAEEALGNLTSIAQALDNLNPDAVL